MSTSSRDVDTEHKEWTEHSTNYQISVGRCTIIGTNRAADLAHAISPFTNDSYALDNGAGGGSLTRSIKDKCGDCRILATDISPGMLEQIDALHLRNVKTQVENAVGLAGLRDETFTHVLTSFAIQFAPDCAGAVRSMYRVLAPGGVAAIVIWSNRIDPPIIHGKACRRFKPDYADLPWLAEGSWTEEGSHRRAMQDAGFKNVTVETHNLPFSFAGASDFAQYWFHGENPVARKLLGDWAERGGNLEQLRNTIEEVVREEYEDGGGIYMNAVIGIGQK